MKKIGDFWLPDVDVRWLRPRLKAWRIYGIGSGPKPGDLLEALAYVDRWTVAIDGGANTGAYTRMLANRFERVLSFEPTPDTFAALERNVSEWGLRDRVRIYERALSNRDEKVALATAPGRRSPSARIVGEGTIPTVRIDDLELTDLAFLKLDVEGYEQQALEGAADTIRRYKPLIMFEDKDRLSARYGDPGGAHGFLESLGAKLLTVVGPKQFDYIYRF